MNTNRWMAGVAAVAFVGVGTVLLGSPAQAQSRRADAPDDRTHEIGDHEGHQGLRDHERGDHAAHREHRRLRDHERREHEAVVDHPGHP